ncbi:ABC transporter substrate-binding protein [Phreatobacter stygius]|uniref:ABC transporter substrate-binding protein n=1 Tax=Phreatobacter stygius TaxID=1940610 RepID=A0A4D7AQJ6_9HYPH|nr:ABC transporter substrate-binding protein [Phreatobacter stygius]QCI63544.1 ABC transporter substrate-binding protein [Phreatobacter stygius]
MLRTLVSILFAAVSGWSAMANEPPPGVAAELAPTGRLRAAINFGNPVLAKRDPATGAPGGVSVALARALAERLGLPVDLVAYEAAGQVTDAARTGIWDIAFLAVDPVRAAEIDFTAPYVLIEGTYLVKATSPLRRVEDVDRAGNRVLATRGSAFALFLTRTLRQAQLVQEPASAPYLDIFVAGDYEAAAGVRQPLVNFARSRPDLRVMDGRFMAIEQAMAIQKGRPAGLRYLRAFLEEMKVSGFVERSLRASGEADAAVAPAAKLD